MTITLISLQTDQMKHQKIRGTTTYERKGNQLILKNYYPESFTVLVLTENKLHLYDMFEVESEETYIKTESIGKFEKIK